MKSQTPATGVMCAKVNAALAGLTLLLSVHAALAAEPPPLADFFRNPVVTRVVMSPNGQHVAAAMAGGPQGRRRLVALNLDDWSKSKVLASFSDADIQSIDWVNDERLVFTLTDAQSAYAAQRGQGLYAVDRDGNTAPRLLIQRHWTGITAPASRRVLDGSHSLLSVLRDGSNDVVVGQTVFDNRWRRHNVNLLRLNTLNAGTQLLTPKAPERSTGWALDAQGQPRVAVARFDGKTRVHWKATADAPWTLLREFDGPAAAEAFTPLGVDRRDRLYAAAHDGNGADTTALLRLDMRAAGAAPQALLKLDGHDFVGGLQRGANGDVLGVRYLAQERGTHWFDPDLKKIQAQVDALLPDTNNLLGCGDCAQPRVVLVTASSDRQPNLYLLFDVAAGTLKPLAASRPWIKPQAMAEREFRHFPARDGLSIPVHVTRPPGQAGKTEPAPMVVLVHGGPWARAAGWQWEAQSQFLASRGYVVVEPEFRSSTGYGTKLFRAGWKQWGLSMQDDVADAARWAIAQGLADPKRMCVAGASYGGYATLMGLIRDPTLFRCGVQWVGVSDLDLLFSTNWQINHAAADFGLPELVGDREKDATQFAATSPLKLAAQLKQPLLMAYGGLDATVDLAHGTKMRNALRPHNPNVEWIEYADEGHDWMLEANNIDFWNRVERFLDRHLKNAP
jgi:dipeptidyl aminopeptidase/acylaminoacyl peptidase